MRVLHGPVNVGNQPWVLSRYERLLGAQSDVVVNYSTWLGYQVDRCLSEYAEISAGGKKSPGVWPLSTVALPGAALLLWPLLPVLG